MKLKHNAGAGTIQRLTKGILGFIFAFGAVISLEFLIVYGLGGLFHSRLVPRGPGWIVIPIAAGVAGWKVLRDVSFSGALGHVVHQMTTMNRLNRLLVAAYGSWVLIIGAYVFFAEPYGYYISGDEWIQIARIIIVPMAVLTAIVFFFRWALQKPQHEEPGQPA